MSDLLGAAPPTYAPPAGSAPSVSTGDAGPAPSPPAGPASDAAPEAPPDVPRDTTPTWELELLISGAVLFGLFQVPPIILSAFAERSPHLGIVGSTLAAPVALLALTLFNGLIGCFVLHLVLRAYWVALVGAHSVFPRGVRWDKQREYGPFQTDIQRTRVRPLPEIIARADNAASLIFATGFVLAASVLTSAAFIGPAVLVVWLLTRALGRDTGLLVGAALYFAALLPIAAAGIVDYKYGARIDPDGRLGRALRRLLVVAASPVPAGLRSLSSVLTSNVPKRVAGWTATVAFLAAMGTAAVQLMPSDTELPGGSNYAFFNAWAPGGSVPPLRYGSVRGGWDASRAGPSIDGEVVTGPYLRLFVPYRPDLHNDALPAACPGLRVVADLPDHPGASDRAAVDAVLRCAARVHHVRIDGRPVDGLRYRFLMDPRTNRRGFVAFVPASALAPGEHLLEVWAARPPRATYPDTPYEIPFWR